MKINQDDLTLKLISFGPLSQNLFNAGYSLMSHINFYTDTFDLNVGLKVPLKSEDPLEAFQLYFTKQYDSLFIKNALLNGPSSFHKHRINSNLLYRYIAYLILSGFVELPQEKLYFYPTSDLTPFVKKVDFITNNEVRFAKKFFTEDRNTLANLYNEISFKIWNPPQLSI